MNKLKKAKVIRWSIILRADNEVGKLTVCLQHLTKAVSASKTEIILVSPDLKHNDVNIKLCEHFCSEEGIDFYYKSDVEDQMIAAVENAKGEFIVFINADTVVSKNFLARMTHAYENFPIEYNIGPVGAVVPVSNKAPSRQKLALPEDAQASQVDSIQGRIEEILVANPDNMKWIITGQVADFCMLVPKKVLKSVGLFNMDIKDETTRGTDFILRLLSMNYYTIVCGNVYTYRDCSTVRLTPQLPIDLPAASDEKVGFLFKVKIDTEHLLEVFINALSMACKVGDGIFVLDTGSKIKLGLTLKEREPKLWEAITKYEKTFEDKDDKVSYNKLLDWAEDAGMTWTFSLETGETIEGRATRNYFERLMHPINPTVMCYSMPEFYFWDDMSSWRADGPWGNVSSIRFSRLFPGHRIKGREKLSSQCGYVAQLPAEVVRPTNLRIRCYTLCDDEHRAMAYKRALTIAKGQDWTHILRDEGIIQYPWRDDVSISVYTPTNQGGEELLNWLDHVWTWTDEIVVGNDCTQLKSEDLSVLNNWGAKVVPCIMGDDYSSGRNMIIKECTKDFIYQMDIDERLTEPLTLFRMVCTDHSAWMFSIDNFQQDGKSIITETARLFRNKEGVKYWGYLHETIDDHLRKSNWKVGLSPVKMDHYGYLKMTPQSAWSKMQRYMDINLKQMKDDPEDSRAYYNLALHLIEDGLVEDAMRLLTTSCYLSGGRVLPVVELAKLHVIRALDLFTLVSKNEQNTHTTMNVTEYSNQMATALAKLRPQHQVVASGHARAFFDTDPTRRTWLYEHLKKMDAKLAQLRPEHTSEDKKELDTEANKALLLASVPLSVPVDIDLGIKLVNPLEELKKQPHLKLV